jgi:hypothetical protein
MTIKPLSTLSPHRSFLKQTALGITGRLLAA